MPAKLAAPARASLSIYRATVAKPSASPLAAAPPPLQCQDSCTGILADQTDVHFFPSVQEFPRSEVENAVRGKTYFRCTEHDVVFGVMNRRDGEGARAWAERVRAARDAFVKQRQKPGAERALPLHTALEEGDDDEALRLIEAKQGLESTDAQGQRPMHVAAAYERVEPLEALLAVGVELEARAAPRPSALPAHTTRFACTRRLSSPASVTFGVLRRRQRCVAGTRQGRVLPVAPDHLQAVGHRRGPGARRRRCRAQALPSRSRPGPLHYCCCCSQRAAAPLGSRARRASRPGAALPPPAARRAREPRRHPADGLRRAR